MAELSSPPSPSAPPPSTPSGQGAAAHLRFRMGVPAVLLIWPDGTLLDAAVPPGVHAENLSSMYATALGFATKALEGVRRAVPYRMRIEDSGGRTEVVRSPAGIIMAIYLDESGHDPKVEQALAEAVRNWGGG